MFDIDYINRIHQQYRFKVDHGKKQYEDIMLIKQQDNGIVKSPDKLSNEEKENIKLALYLSEIIKAAEEGPFRSNKTPEEILKELQLDFQIESLLSSIFPYKIKPLTMLWQVRPCDLIIMDLIKEGSERKSLATLYLQHTLSQFGRKAINFKIKNNFGLEYGLTYDFEKLNNGNGVYKDSEIYKALFKRLKEKVEEMIKTYIEGEKEDHRNNRLKYHAKNIAKIKQYAANKLPDELNIQGPGLFWLLIGAQEVAAHGQTEQEKTIFDKVLQHRDVRKAIKQYLNNPVSDTIFNRERSGANGSKKR